MMNKSIKDLGMTDTEYAQLVSKGYEPVLQRQLIALGEDPDKARKFTRFVGLLRTSHRKLRRSGKNLWRYGKMLVDTNQTLTDQ